MKRTGISCCSLIRIMLLVSGLSLIPVHGSRAGEVSVAVASNFTAAMEIISENFTKETGHKVINSYASSGKLYAQINHGAPFELLLSADLLYPQRLEREGLAVTGTRVTYATGKLVLCGAADLDALALKTRLEQLDFQHLATANPKTAPYGAAAMRVIEQLVSGEIEADKLVLGENISQTFQFVHSGAADLGFVSLAQIRALENRGESIKYWIVPQDLYTPIEQQMVLLTKGQNNPAARALYDYLLSQSALTVISDLGYEISSRRLPVSGESHDV